MTKLKDSKFMFQCTECDTKYYTPEDEAPPPITWKDGHVCTLKKVRDVKNGKRSSLDSRQ